MYAKASMYSRIYNTILIKGEYTISVLSRPPEGLSKPILKGHASLSAGNPILQTISKTPCTINFFSYL
jgi:hypothetical protein